MRASVVAWLRALTPRTFALFAIAIAASIGFVVLAAFVRTGDLDRVDVAVELAVHRLDSRVCDVVMMAATLVGTSFVVYPAVAIAAALAVHRSRRALAAVLVLDTIVVQVADFILKLVFSRARPRLFEKVALPGDYSFPSGHAMAAMGVYGVVAAVLIALYPRARRVVIVAAILLIALIGFSRIYLGVHWPFDVVGGFLGGVPPLVVSVHLLHRYRQAYRGQPLNEG